jgi:hypothetical protein
MTKRKWLLMILALSVLVRVGVALYLGNVVDAPRLLIDQRSYDALARRILTGHGYSFDRGWYPFTPPDTPTAHWSFLHPLFIAAIYALFGPNPLAARLTQAVLGGLLLPWMVHRFARQLLSGRETIALIAAAMTAVYGYFVLYAATLMTETFFIALVVWSLEISLRLGAQLRARGSASRRDLVLLGLSLGLATLMRQSILPWVPVLFLWLLWQTREHGTLRQTMLRLILPGLIMAALILPWTYRNYRVYGEFLLLNSNTGYAMYSAQHPMHGTRFSEFAAAPLPADLIMGNEAQMDRELMRRGLGFVRDEPGRYLLLCLDRVRAYFEFWPSPDTSLLHSAGRIGSYALFLPFMFYGLFLAVKEGRFAGTNTIIPLFVVFYPVLHILTWAMVRYRLPVDALTMPLAALAIERLVVRGHAWLTIWRGANMVKYGRSEVRAQRTAPCDTYSLNVHPGQVGNDE